MNNRISFLDLQPSSVQMQMTVFVKRFTPRSWWPHLMPKMVQLWASILLRSAFGDVNGEIQRPLGIRGELKNGVGTWFRTATEVNYIWVHAGLPTCYKLPEWGMGVWREVTSAFQRFTSPHADWSDDFANADMDALATYLAQFSKGCRVFEALGILGGTWCPEDKEAF